MISEEKSTQVEIKIKVGNIITRLRRSLEDVDMFRKILTEVLNSETVAAELTGLTQSAIFYEYFPEFYEKNKWGESFINCQQNSYYHRYGVFKHTLIAIETVGGKDKPFTDDQIDILKWTMLLHDLGKPYVKVVEEDGRESFAGHEEKSVEIGVPILRRMGFSESVINDMALLILNHDKFLNINDATPENFQTLVNNLDGRKDLFYLLLEVKYADARAKSEEAIELADKVIAIFREMANNYFQESSISFPGTGLNKLENDQLAGSFNSVAVDPELLVNNVLRDTNDYTSPEVHEKMRNSINQMVLRKDIEVLYQPVFDIEKAVVYGYEGFTRNKGNASLNITRIIDYSREMGKYDRLQQAMFIHAIEKFAEVEKREVNRLFVNIDVSSFEKYANKPRIYDMMDRNKIVVELKNYQKLDNVKIGEIVEEIRKLGGEVCLNNFDGEGFTIQDLEKVNIDYLKFDIFKFGDFLENPEKLRFIDEVINLSFIRDFKLIMCGIESFPQYKILKDKGVKFMQGYFLARPQNDIPLWGQDIVALLKGREAAVNSNISFAAVENETNFNPNDPNAQGNIFASNQTYGG